MNYPVWELPGAGWLIAAVAILHVVVSHFAVGGGLFLALAERRARRSADGELLDFLRRHSRFFILLTLVQGAVTGVGIWFAIGLVQPQATAALVSSFVWAWAIEWIFFVVEIAAAMVYYYGWDALDSRRHAIVGWIYVAAAWLSLVAINGILTFMLTPGAWLTSHGFLDGLINPTFAPGVAARSIAAVGLTGLYVLVTATSLAAGPVRTRIVRHAVSWWIAPAVLLLPPTLAWYLSSAARAGVTVGEAFGATSDGFGALLSAIVHGSSAGYPPASIAALVVLVASAACVALAVTTLVRAPTFVIRGAAILALAAGAASFGAAEWVREDLRKPFVIGRYMFVNGVRLVESAQDAFSVGALNARGVLATSPWAGGLATRTTPGDPTDAVLRQGRALFVVECSICHTRDGHLGVRRLVQGMRGTAIEGLLGRLALPETSGGHVASWSAGDLRLRTWRGRRMPPFVGTVAERQALARYLAAEGGATESPAQSGAGEPDVGRQYFERNCDVCHGPSASVPLVAKGRPAAAFYAILGRLPSVNAMMPPFDGTDEERHAVARYLAGGGR
jgi:mono/diheme cytochrome c family protein